MPTLLDHIDRFSYTAQSIQAAARAALEPQPGPYVRAVLSTPLGDLARDADTSELGLFTLVPNTSATTASGDDAGAAVSQKAAITRVEFPGATPLRKPAGASKHIRRENDKEPEVYAQAALKYLDRYQSIRPMPRARQEVEAIVDRLNAIRSDIQHLTEASEQSSKSSARPTPTIQDEEKRIQELHLRIKQLKARKQVLQKKRDHEAEALPAKGKDNAEEAFWAQPTTTRKTRSARKSLLIPTLARGTVGPDDTLLLDAHMKVEPDALLGDVSMSSLVDATPTPMPTKIMDPAHVPLPSRPVSNSPAPSPFEASQQKEAASEDPITNENADFSMDEGDDTVILAKRPSPVPEPPTTVQHAPSTPPPAQIPDTPAMNVAATPKPGVPATPGTARIGRVRITTDVERMAAKIWATVGDIIMPGHSFSTAAAATTNKPPRAKETIALLQNLAAQKPPPISPTGSHSTFSLTTGPAPAGPNTHAILTAHLLLALINEAPRHAMPLAATKAVLAEANKSISSGIPVDPLEANLGLLGGGDKAMETRALYGCVAKRLLKIDRSGREQLVRFDI